MAYFKNKPETRYAGLVKDILCWFCLSLNSQDRLTFCYHRNSFLLLVISVVKASLTERWLAYFVLHYPLVKIINSYVEYLGVLAIASYPCLSCMPFAHSIGIDLLLIKYSFNR